MPGKRAVGKGRGLDREAETMDKEMGTEFWARPGVGSEEMM